MTLQEPLHHLRWPFSGKSAVGDVTTGGISVYATWPRVTALSPFPVVWIYFWKNDRIKIANSHGKMALVWWGSCPFTRRQQCIPELVLFIECWTFYEESPLYTDLYVQYLCHRPLDRLDDTAQNNFVTCNAAAWPGPARTDGREDHPRGSKCHLWTMENHGMKSIILTL